MPFAEYEVEEIISSKEGRFKTRSGSELVVYPNWIESGYSYTIKDPDDQQPTLGFQTGKIGKIKIKEADHEKEKVEIEFVLQGKNTDPEIKKFLKGVRSARRANSVTGCIVGLLIFAAFILLGKIWTWIFGEPDDGFINMMMPLVEDKFQAYSLP